MICINIQFVAISQTLYIYTFYENMYLKFDRLQFNRLGHNRFQFTPISATHLPGSPGANVQVEAIGSNQEYEMETMYSCLKPLNKLHNFHYQQPFSVTEPLHPSLAEMFSYLDHFRYRLERRKKKQFNLSDILCQFTYPNCLFLHAINMLVYPFSNPIRIHISIHIFAV